jgi:hypothetical protein
LGQYNSLPIDTLVKIAQDLQELVFTLAKTDLSSLKPVDMNNFKIELVGFKTGSAIPEFAYSERCENKSGMHWQVHRNTVNEKFVEISNSDDYGKLAVLYPESIKRNPIVENLYSFVNDFGNAPANFVDYDEVTEKTTPIFKIHRFKPGVKKELISVIKEVNEKVVDTDEAVGKI